MPFNPQKRYLAFAPSVLANADDLREEYGAIANTAPDHKGGEDIKTLLCGLDNSDTGKLRASILGVTAIPLQLTDGRYCLGGFWSQAVIDAFESGEIDGEELTVEEVKSLTPTSEI